jgi:hypothetical protein
MLAWRHIAWLFRCAAIWKGCSSLILHKDLHLAVFSKTQPKRSARPRKFRARPPNDLHSKARSRGEAGDASTQTQEESREKPPYKTEFSSYPRHTLSNAAYRCLSIHLRDPAEAASIYASSTRHSSKDENSVDAAPVGILGAMALVHARSPHHAHNQISRFKPFDDFAQGLVADNQVVETCRRRPVLK